MTITIRPETFIVVRTEDHEVVGKKTTHRWTNVIGTVELNLGRGKTVLAEAIRDEDGAFRVRGFVGRYLTVQTPWRASVEFTADGTMGFVHFGRDDRSGRFNKRNGISYEPETYAKI